MSLPLPPSSGPCNPMTSWCSSRRRLHRDEGRSRPTGGRRPRHLPGRRVATATRKCAVPDLPAVASVLVAV